MATKQVIVEVSKESELAKTFHARTFITDGGDFDSFEGGKYFVLSRDGERDTRGILRKICLVNGVESAWTKGYATHVTIGKAFDWHDDDIESAVIAILEAL